MKDIFLLLVILLPCYLTGLTRTVALDGTQQYTVIQAAIEASNDGDIVLVYPGRYIENINLNGHSITLASLYAQSPQQAYIDSTIIDGNLSTCIRVDNGEIVTINGFTLVNNEQNLNQVVITGVGGGGGIRVKSSTADIRNCIIRNCIAIDGAGLSIGLDSTVSLANNKIFTNRALSAGGGVIFSSGGVIIFNPSNLNSIYDNTAASGMDIFIGWMEDYPDPTNIILNIGSRALSAPDNYFITLHHATANVNITQSYFPEIDNDVYVSPDGDDSNSGLAASTPFKTIRHALQVISSNPDNPRTLHLSAGTFSRSLNGQSLPLSLKQYVKIVGAGAGQTIIDGELHNTFFAARNIQDVVLSDVSFYNARAISTNPIELVECSDIELRNLVLSNNQGAYASGVYLLRCDDIVLENLDIGNTVVANYNTTIYAIESNNVYVNGVISHDNRITYEQDYDLGFTFRETDVVLRNSIIANNRAPDAFVLFYQTVDPDNFDCNLDMSNVLIYNNSITQCSWAFAPVYLQNRFQSMQLKNCTFAGNQGAGIFTQIFAYADVQNHISYNPGHAGELYLRNHIWSDTEFVWYDAEVSIRNSLFRSNSINSDLPDLVTFTDNIFNGNPLFLGSETDTLSVSQPEYYYLSANSPCINTGVADTTGMNLPLMDLAGNYRVWDNNIDMGCYEYGAAPYVSIDNPENPSLPNRIALSTYPNPICLSGTRSAYAFIEFTLPEQPKEQPIIEIFNIKGQKVKTIRLNQSYSGMVQKAGLSSQVKQNGEFYSTIWDCKNEQNRKIVSGIYLVKVTSGKHQSTSKMMVLK